MMEGYVMSGKVELRVLEKDDLEFIYQLNNNPGLSQVFVGYFLSPLFYIVLSIF